MLTRLHYFERMIREMRPQDETLDGSLLKFETMEHGGEFPDCFPNAVKITARDGRWCVYTAVTDIDGPVVRSHGFDLGSVVSHDNDGK